MPARSYFFKRLLAGLIDFVLSFILFCVLCVGWKIQLKILFFIVIPFLHWYLNSSVWQGTLGKRAVDLAVFGADGKRISLLLALRYAACGMLVPFTFGLSFLTILVRADKRPMHDVLGGVWVMDDASLKDALQ